MGWLMLEHACFMREWGKGRERGEKGGRRKVDASARGGSSAANSIDQSRRTKNNNNSLYCYSARTFLLISKPLPCGGSSAARARAAPFSPLSFAPRDLSARHTHTFGPLDARAPERKGLPKAQRLARYPDAREHGRARGGAGPHAGGVWRQQRPRHHRRRRRRPPADAAVSCPFPPRLLSSPFAGQPK